MNFSTSCEPFTLIKINTNLKNIYKTLFKTFENICDIMIISDNVVIIYHKFIPMNSIIILS